MLSVTPQHRIIAASTFKNSFKVQMTQLRVIQVSIGECLYEMK